MVISLDRSGDRLDTFYRELPDPWPFPRPVAMRAIDGNKVKPPPGYQAKPPAGSWGCFRSHYRVLEDALNEDVDSLLVLEDDVTFVPHFAQRAQEFFGALPSDWEIIYLGGKHLHREIQLPIRVNSEVYRPHNVHSSFAYGLRGRSTIERVYEHINSPERWGPGHCIDHRFGEMHPQYAGGVYAPGKWLAGHRAGRSTIRGSKNSQEFFPDADWLCNAPVDTNFLVIAGKDPHLTSALASAIHLLGIPLGENRDARLASPRIAKSVAPGLNALIERLYDRVWWEPTTHFDHRVASLRQWASQRCAMPKNRDHALLGAYHECLPMMGREVCAAWNNPWLLLVETEAARNPSTVTSGAAQVRHRKLQEACQGIEKTGFSRVVRCTENELNSPTRCLEEILSQLVITIHPERLVAASQLLERAMKE